MILTIFHGGPYHRRDGLFEYFDEPPDKILLEDFSPAVFKDSDRLCTFSGGYYKHLKGEDGKCRCVTRPDGYYHNYVWHYSTNSS